VIEVALLFGLSYLLLDIWLGGISIQAVHIYYQVVLILFALSEILHQVFVSERDFYLVNNATFAIVDILKLVFVLCMLDEE
jgi:hypothetical protein